MLAFLSYVMTGFLHVLSSGMLALAQSAQRRATGLPELSAFQTTRARLSAVILLGFALAWQVRTEGGGFGVLLWSGFATLAALAVTLVLAFWPRVLMPLARWMAAPRMGKLYFDG